MYFKCIILKTMNSVSVITVNAKNNTKYPFIQKSVKSVSLPWKLQVA